MLLLLVVVVVVPSACNVAALCRRRRHRESIPNIAVCACNGARPASIIRPDDHAPRCFRVAAAQRSR